jgi:RNA polymerase sigma factor (sigma-70 family)
MATNYMSEFIQHLRKAVLLRDGVGLTDEQLLEDYLNRREQAALEALVGRHAPMVWGVCRRVLGNHHDAEDAFQATFLILVRKAASIASPKLLANWLYGVAHQTALKARATAAKRRARERQVAPMPEPAATEPDLWDDLQRLLDQELSRLPDPYRVAIVLCDLEGKSRKEAARQLGVPEGTLAARVARGRVMLAKRLGRHGLVVSGGTLAAVLAGNVASAALPTLVASSTIKVASLYAAGQMTARGLISANVAALTEGVVKTMLLAKLKMALALGLVIGLLGGVFLLADPASVIGQTPDKEKEPPKSPAKEASSWAGEWLREGNADQPCAIFQQGRVLLLVNEDGEFATGKITEANKITTRWSQEDGLVGDLVDKGKTISWGNGTTWKRP